MSNIKISIASPYELCEAGNQLVRLLVILLIFRNFEFFILLDYVDYIPTKSQFVLQTSFGYQVHAATCSFPPFLWTRRCDFIKLDLSLLKFRKLIQSKLFRIKIIEKFSMIFIQKQNFREILNDLMKFVYHLEKLISQIYL